MEDTAVIKIVNGFVKGVPSIYNKSVTVFKGLPYAASPSGENRWRAPQPAQPWEGSEDCLSVNVWTPNPSGNVKLPVFVWIHGGRFIAGAGSEPAFDGTSLAEKGIVVVTLNYRLGIPGWLASTELSAESGHNASGNYGLLDQLAALRWVRDNIAAFGGNPDEVTVGGQSAGGPSAALHVSSPLSHGLLHRAINESGFRYPHDPLLSGLAPAYRLKEHAEGQGDAVLKDKGASTIAELRRLPLDKLLEGNNRNADGGGTPPIYRPCLDGYFFPYNYSESLQRGLAADIPILTGYNSDEGGTYSDPSFSVADFKACAEQKYGPLAARFLQLYPTNEPNTALETWNEAARDNSRVTTAMWVDEFHKQASSSIYGYFYTHAPPERQKREQKDGAASKQPPMPVSTVPRNVYTYTKSAQGAARGAFHGAEIIYVFNNLDTQKGYPWTETDRAVAKTMSTYWSNFIRTGNPNGDGLPIFRLWITDI